MAQEQDINQFSGNLSEGTAQSYIPKNAWTHARNCITNSSTGDKGLLGNEPSNLKLIQASFPIIGTIFLYDDRWFIVSTNGYDSEIGIFRNSTATYDVLVDPSAAAGMNLSAYNLITGVSKQLADGTWQVYWADKHRNPDRTMNTTNIPWKGTYRVDTNKCQIFTPYSPLQLDVAALKLTRDAAIPCVKAVRGAGYGNLLNGSYCAAIAYTIGGQKVTDYFGLSNVVSVFDHDNVAGSIEIKLSGLDKTYLEYELVIISTINQQTVARQLGFYSTAQTTISVDNIPDTLTAVPLSYLPITNSYSRSSNLITELSDHLIRIGPKTKFDFNYQPLANQIQTQWTVTEYPADYYRRGGVNYNALRDENYALYLRWIYTDSERSASFHIPGRVATYFNVGGGSLVLENVPYSGTNAIETSVGDTCYLFEAFNTATGAPLSPPQKQSDGGWLIATGDMGYYQTDELYPIDQPQVWGPLCGENIRHHKMPNRSLATYTDLYSNSPTAGTDLSGGVIRALGVQFSNIKGPVDNAGVPIPGIVGYEILKADRAGNKTIIGKGIINNTFKYTDAAGNPTLYQNYPYNSLEDDPFISSHVTSTGFSGNIQNLNKIPFIDSGDNPNKNIYTFHSPDTSFHHPFLGMKELKLDGIVYGNPVLKFQVPEKHPKNKLATNFAFFVAALTGIGYAVMELNGKRSTTQIAPHRAGMTAAGSVSSGSIAIVMPAPGGGGVIAPLIDPIYSGIAFAGIGADTLVQGVFQGANTVYNGVVDLLKALDPSGQAVDNIRYGVLDAAAGTALADYSMIGQQNHTTYESGLAGAMGTAFRAVGALPLFVNLWGQGTEEALQLLLNFSQAQQYALQQISHCFYDQYDLDSQKRFYIDNANYLRPGLQNFSGINVNNINRSSTVILKTFPNTSVPDIGGSLMDNSKQTLSTLIGSIPSIYDDPISAAPEVTASSYYASLKVKLRNQYGQIGDSKQIPVGCINLVTMDESNASNNIFTSPIIYIGDTYITRYTEKNTMPFFTDWMYNQPDNHEFDYLQSRSLQFPGYWMNSTRFDTGDFLTGLKDTIINGISGGVTNIGNVVSGIFSNGGANTAVGTFNDTNTMLPTALRALDVNGINVAFIVKKGYFYLFVSGVRDFYVESEINVADRDWEDPIIKRHYDEYTFPDLQKLFSANPDIIKVDNFYKYDFSLSVSNSFINMASWGRVQARNYDPAIAALSFIFHPKRIAYSMPQQTSQIVDAWRIFLANDYRDFKSNVTSIESIGLTGALIFFQTDSPLQIQGEETFATDAGTKVIISDGGFLAQATQSLSNSDRPYQFGACRDFRSIVNTPAGLFWISQDQGKILTIKDGIVNIAMEDLNWWFALYLPYKLLEDFPDFENVENPIIGIGCQTVYDNENGLIYFSKKDYRYRKENFDSAGSGIFWNSSVGFYLQLLGNFIGPVSLGDPNYFEEASWTISYDIKTSQWISWHDWHPDLVLPSKDTFCTIKGNAIWKHNFVCNSFCNYYGVDYPWEVEYEHSSGIQVNTLRSIEYYMEVYKYASNCYDRYLFLNANFDEAVIYTNEQCSGLLKLNLSDVNDPYQANLYPIYNGNSVDVLFSKVEGKYRLNTFYDLTSDRGEFSNAERMIWLTGANGYVRNLNPQNLEYAKDVFQQKRFRNYNMTVFLRRRVSGNMKFLMLFAENKQLESKR